MRQRLISTFAGLFCFLFASSAYSADWRAEFGIGAHGGEPEVSFGGATDDLDTDTGIAITGQLWADGVAEKMPWLTLGAQYLRLTDSDFSEAA